MPRSSVRSGLKTVTPPRDLIINGRDRSLFIWRDRVLAEAASVAHKGGTGGIHFGSEHNLTSFSSLLPSGAFA